MSADHEELIDYEDEQDVPSTAGHGTNGAVVVGIVDAEADKEKKNFSGIHATGFR